MNDYTAIFMRAAVTILTIVFAIVFIGAALIPALVAYLYSRWLWLLMYPGLMLLFLIYAGVSRSKK